MYDYVIIHGSYGCPFENWTPWLFNALTAKGKQVLTPQLPVIDQCYDNWKEVLVSYDKFIDENTSFIAHSLGPAFVLDYLLERQKKVKNLYFAAPFYGLINIKEFDDVNCTFFRHQNLSNARQFFDKAYCFYSDNDPYVPRSMSENISRELMASVQVVRGGGHLNASAGFTEFQDLLKEIEANE